MNRSRDPQLDKIYPIPEGHGHLTRDATSQKVEIEWFPYKTTSKFSDFEGAGLFHLPIFIRLVAGPTE
jgi:hypothetical protein